MPARTPAVATCAGWRGGRVWHQPGENRPDVYFGYTPGALSLLWNAPPRKRFENLSVFTFPATSRRVPGFIDALYAVDFRIPDAPGEGVYIVPVPGVLKRFEIGRVGNGLGVYVK